MSRMFFKVMQMGTVRMLAPTDRASASVLNKFNAGDIVSTSKPSKPRNPKHSDKFWALMDTVWGATAIQDQYASPRALAKAIELALGHFDTIKLPDGTVGYDIHSLSFASMSQDQFADFYERAITVITEQLVPHLDREELKREVERMIQ